MKKLTCIICCLYGLLTHAQNEIKGQIIDASTNQSIEGANVYLPELEKGTTTDAEGMFYLKNLPNGPQNFIISFIGYGTRSVYYVFPGNDFFKIELNPTVIEMEDIIISTPFHKLQSENVMKVDKESVMELKKQGSITLSEGVSNLTGVNTITTGLGIGKPVIRGLSSNRVLVYTQGVRLENQQYGGEHGLGLSSNGVESIEVIKGPASLLYGSDALGGVLYINPEKFAASNAVEADVSTAYFSNTRGYNSNLGIKQSGEHYKFIFRAGVTEHSDYQTKDYRVTNSRFREVDLKGGIGYQNRHFKTDLRYNVNLSKLGLPETIGEQSTQRRPLLPYQEVGNHVLSSKSTIFFNSSKLDFNVGLIYNDRKEFEEHHHEDEDHEDEEHEDDDHEEHEEEHEEISEPALQMKLKTLNYDVKYHLPERGKFETIVGVQGMTQSNTNYGEETLIPDATTNDIGVLATSHIHFQRADLQLGVRYDHRKINVFSGLQKNFNSFNAAIGLKTNLFKTLTTRINLASGFRAPNLAELASDGSHEGTNRYEIGNENLSNENNLQFDLSLEYKSDHLEFFVNGFYNAVSNYIFLSPNGDFIDEDPVFVYLQDDARLYGGEIGFHIHPHPLDWLHFESSFETVTGKRSQNNYLPLIPANALTNVLHAEFDNKWLTNGYAFIKNNLVFSQNNTSQFETPTASYQLWSTGAGGTIEVFNNPLDLVISMTNIFDKAYISHLSRLKPDGIFDIGRNFSIELTYRL